MGTVSFIAKPVDRRCQWWAVRIPAGFVRGIRLDDKTSLRPLGFLKSGEDLELEEGEAVLTSEARHHNKARGYDVCLHVVAGGVIRKFSPTLDTKEKIKCLVSPEHWNVLKHGSGEVAACLRVLMFLELAGEGQIRQAFPGYAAAKYGPVEVAAEEAAP